MDCSSGESKYHDELSCRTLRTSLTAKGNILSISVHELHHLASLSLSDIAMYVCLQLGNSVLTISINYRHTVMRQNRRLRKGNSSINMTFCRVQVFTCLHLTSKTIFLTHGMLKSPTTNSP